MFFTSDSIIFLQLDSIGFVKDSLGLLQGQIRLSEINDTITNIRGFYYERIEDHFAKITEGNEFGYPLIVGEDCEITPNYRLRTSVIKQKSITLEMNIDDYK